MFVDKKYQLVNVDIFPAENPVSETEMPQSCSGWEVGLATHIGADGPRCCVQLILQAS